MAPTSSREVAEQIAKRAVVVVKRPAGGWTVEAFGMCSGSSWLTRGPAEVFADAHRARVASALEAAADEEREACARIVCTEADAHTTGPDGSDVIAALLRCDDRIRARKTARNA